MKSLRYGVACLACVLIIFTVGCSIVDGIKTPNEDVLMAEIFDAFENEEYDSISSRFMPEVIPEDENSAYRVISEYIDGTLTDYKKTGYYYNVSANNEGKSEELSLVYDVNTKHDKYVVSMVLYKTAMDWKIYRYNIIRASELQGNGAIIDFKNFDIVQMLLLLYSAGCLGLVVYSVVVCAKSPIRLKALWIVIILLLHSGIKLALSAGFFTFNLQIININISYLQKFVNGDRVIQVLVPVGAVLFLCLKRRLIKSAKKRQEIQGQHEPS